jgi:hypothetical protein
MLVIVTSAVIAATITETCAVDGIVLYLTDHVLQFRADIRSVVPKPQLTKASNGQSR